MSRNVRSVSESIHVHASSLSTLHDSELELYLESNNEHLGLDEHFGCVHYKLDACLDPSLLGVGQVLNGVLDEVRGVVAHLYLRILVDLAEDAGYLGSVVLDSLVRLLLELFEVDTDCLGCELLFIVLQEFLLDDVLLVEIL